MNELFPILAGLAVGGALALVAPRLRPRYGAVAALVLGTLATIVSGEYQIGWEFLLIDVPLVAISSVVGLTAVRAVRARATSGPADGGRGTA
jgi:hypothetical protein